MLMMVIAALFLVLLLLLQLLELLLLRRPRTHAALFMLLLLLMLMLPQDQGVLERAPLLLVRGDGAAESILGVVGMGAHFVEDVPLSRSQRQKRMILRLTRFVLGRANPVMLFRRWWFDDARLASVLFRRCLLHSTLYIAADLMLESLSDTLDADVVGDVG